MKMSYTMQASLDVIKAAGHVVVAAGGGWWNDADGHRLFFAPEDPKDWRKKIDVCTLTIYALHARGLLLCLGSERTRKGATYVTREWVE